MKTCMDDRVAIKILPKLLIANNTIDISVKGHSMIPTLFEGDTITICKKDKYIVGDILVFAYKFDMLLIHRLVKFDDKYFCKGDNSFRLEDVELHDIIGKVVKVNGKDISPWPKWKIDMSYKINRSFFECRYNIQKTIQTDIYKIYEQLVLKKCDVDLRFVINKQMLPNFKDAFLLCLLKLEKEQQYILKNMADDVLCILSTAHSINELLDAIVLNNKFPISIMEDAIEAFIFFAFIDKLIVLSN